MKQAHAQGEVVPASCVLIAFGLWLGHAAFATRASYLLNNDALRSTPLVADGMMFLVSSLWLLRVAPRFWFFMTSLAAAILIHSACHIYWPSLQAGIPLQDFLLGDRVSANYSFNSGVTYLRHLGLAILSGAAARSAYQIACPAAQRTFAYWLILIAFVTFAVAGVQTHLDLHFLADGSGSAVSGLRATSLLEDSGASTVYCGGIISGLIFVTLFAYWPVRQRIFWILGTLLGLVCGAGTGGRVFFVMVASSGFLAGIFTIFCFCRNAHGIKARPVGYLIQLLLLSAGLSAAIAAQSPLKKVISALTLPSEWGRAGLLSWLNSTLLRLDLPRAVPIKTMMRAIELHPWAGTGLGSFYSNYFEFLPWALSTGGIDNVDVPSSFYLSILSELGLVGWIFIGGLILLVIKGTTFELIPSLSRPMYSPNSSSVAAADRWLWFGYGGFFALLISLTIGMHFLFASVSSFAGLLTFCLISVKRNGSLLLKRGLFFWWAGCCSLLIANCMFMWLQAPRQPAFRWTARGKPQIPLSLSIPISTAGRKGIWLSSGGELLYHHQPVKLFVEMPPEFYPVTVLAQLFGPDGRLVETISKVVERYDRINPGRDIEIAFQKEDICPSTPQPENFCSFRLRTTPVWIWLGQAVGVFVENP